MSQPDGSWLDIPKSCKRKQRHWSRKIDQIRNVETFFIFFVWLTVNSPIKATET